MLLDGSRGVFSVSLYIFTVTGGRVLLVSFAYEPYSRPLDAVLSLQSMVLAPRVRGQGYGRRAKDEHHKRSRQIGLRHSFR